MDGDRVADTNPQASPSWGCPAEGINSCPEYEGLDDVHNFMNYSNDACMYEFTEGQLERMQIMWAMYRS